MAKRVTGYPGVLLLFVMAFTSLPQSGAASPINLGANYYELVLVPDPFTGANNSWGTAAAAAAASIFLGANGHLATVTSQSENDFLVSLIPDGITGFQGAWLGGDYLQWLVGPEAGQLLTYSNWGGSEPNNMGLTYMNLGNSFVYIPQGQWADDSFVQGFPDGSDPVIGYFVEYESPQVPEPATLTMLGLGLLGIGRAKRRV